MNIVWRSTGPSMGCLCKITGPEKRRRADPDVDLGRARLLELLDDAGAGRAPDDGIIQLDDPFSGHTAAHGIELDPDGIFALALCRFDKSPPNIIVFHEPADKRDTRFLAITHSGIKAGIRYAQNNICFDRELPGEQTARAQPGFMDTDLIELTVRTGKINIFKMQG